jgi:two-component sensor histidine kinase
LYARLENGCIIGLKNPVVGIHPDSPNSDDPWLIPEVPMNEVLRVLQVEGSMLDASSSERALAKAGYSLHCQRVVNAEEMQAALQREPWDVIISDYRLPQFDAPAALLLLHESGQDIPFIVVSGAIGEELALAIMKSGAQDYLLKDDLARLGPAVERELRDARTRHERSLAQGALQQSEERVEEQRAALNRQTVSLHQREMLLREIHHRVKNNMQVMSSLLSLQARAALHPETRRMLEDNQNRIQSMALLHEILYQSEDLAMVDFPKYVLRTVDYLFRSSGMKDRRIGLNTELDPLALELDDALPLGLLISEVISNSVKHAFPEGRGGEVSVFLRQQSATVISLVLSDDGIGLPQGLDWTTSRSLGLRLVRALAQQLRGTLEIRSQRGTEIRLTFPVRHGDSNPPPDPLSWTA